MIYKLPNDEQTKQEGTNYCLTTGPNVLCVFFVGVDFEKHAHGEFEGLIAIKVLKSQKQKAKQEGPITPELCGGLILLYRCFCVLFVCLFASLFNWFLDILSKTLWAW